MSTAPVSAGPAAPVTRVLAQARFEAVTLLRNGEQLLVAVLLPAAVLVGLLVILSPLLVARLLALGGWPLTPVAVVLVGVGFAVELLAWASGFGAMLVNAFTRWQARRPFRGGPMTNQV